MMLTSFFGKSSPINFLLLGIFIFIVALLQEFSGTNWQLDLATGAHFMAMVLLLIFSMLLLDFIIRKNKLTQSHTFGIFIFSCVALLFWSYLDVAMLISQIFMLFGLRRIFSLTSDKNIEKKILDASIWILIASYFYFWSILFMVLLFMAIFFRNHREFRYYFIPVIGFIGMFLISTAFFYLKEDSFSWFLDWTQSISFTYTGYGSPVIMIGITFLLSVLIWSLLHRIRLISEVQKKYKSNFKLVIYAAVISIVMTAFSAVKSGSELLFMAAPMAIVVAGYLERKEDLLLKEWLCWIFLLLPLITFFY